MNKKGETMIMGLSFIIALIIVGGFYYFNKDCIYDIEEHKVTDIIQISMGGFFSSDKCILNTTDGKLILNNRFCNLQIGDSFYKKFNPRDCVLKGEEWYSLHDE